MPDLNKKIRHIILQLRKNTTIPTQLLREA